MTQIYIYIYIYIYIPFYVYYSKVEYNLYMLEYIQILNYYFNFFCIQ